MRMDTNSQQTAVYKDHETQELLNTPPTDNRPLDPKDKEFLDLIMRLIEEKKIDLYKPSSLLSLSLYDSLDDEAKAKADLESMNMLTTIREIHGLIKAGFEGSFQVNNLVSRLRVAKERSEEVGGDIFII